LANKKNKTVNLFMVYSPLHCLCAELIVRHFEVGARNVVFHLKQEFSKCLNHELWDDVVYHPWPRFDPEPGMFGRIRRTRSNLDLVAHYCTGADEISLHTTVIDTEAINYHINYLKGQFPDADFHVRLFPDGVMNLKRHPQGCFKESLQYFRFIRRLVYPKLRYYTFKGDRTGSDDQIVDMIYTLPTFPYEYEASKIIVLPQFGRNEIEHVKEQVLKRALVIGQPLIAYKGMTKESVERVTHAIYDYLKENGIDEIYYKSHPRDNTREYALDEYRELIIDEPLEQHLAGFPYGVVIGVCSTALLTGRMVLPEWCRVVSCGMNLMRFPSDEARVSYVQIFNQLRVETIEL
jgi:Alpha-2,8-polysialyltransferase (POLYST)